MINHISSVVRSCFFHLCCLSKLRQYQNRQTANTIAVSLVLACQGWTTATVVCGACLWTSYWYYSESRILMSLLSGVLSPVNHWILLQDLSLKQRGQITSPPFSVSYTGYLLICVLTTKLGLLCRAAWMAQPSSAFKNLLIPRLPSGASPAVFYPLSSSQPQCWHRKQQKHFGISLTSAAPKLWNSLLFSRRQQNSKKTLKKNLKTYLFSEH